MFSKKKGSLELSVNAIVILILAITILGLGIGFIKSMFDKTTSQIVDINKDIASKMTQDLKDSTERIKLDQDNLEITQGRKDKEIYIGLRNEYDKTLTFTLNGAGNIDAVTDPGKWKGDDSVITCFSAFDSAAKLSGTNSNSNSINFNALKKISIVQGDIYVGKIVIGVLANAPVGTYTCSVIIESPESAGQQYARADFMITVSD